MPEVVVTRNVHCPFSSAIPLVEAFHRDARHRVGPHPIFESDVECEVATTRDYTDSTRLHDALVLQWRAHRWFPLPRLRGFITVRPNGAMTEIRIRGTYLPPLGAVGRVFDAIFGTFIARLTLERFMNALAAYIDSHYGAKRMPHV
ncbi:MAG: hypothetical protein ABI282_08380 [Candidatus Baltobacteraceae bacterium]